MRLVAVTDLMTRVRRRADIENAQDRFPDSEVLSELNEGIAELWDEVLRARGKPFYRITIPMTATGGTPLFQLPGNFYQLVGVETTAPGTLVGYPLEEFQEADHASLLSMSAQGWAGRVPYRYASRFGYGGGYAGSPQAPGVDYLEILPTPQASTIFNVHYVPTSPMFTGVAGEMFDGFGGWEEFAVLEAAMRLSEKDADAEKAATLGAKKDALRSRIQGMAPKRDRTAPSKVSDTYSARTRAFGRGARWPR